MFFSSNFSAPLLKKKTTQTPLISRGCLAILPKKNNKKSWRNSAPFATKKKNIILYTVSVLMSLVCCQLLCISLSRGGHWAPFLSHHYWLLPAHFPPVVHSRASASAVFRPPLETLLESRHQIALHIHIDLASHLQQMS